MATRRHAPGPRASTQGQPRARGDRPATESSAAKASRTEGDARRRRRRRPRRRSRPRSDRRRRRTSSRSRRRPRRPSSAMARGGSLDGHAVVVEAAGASRPRSGGRSTIEGAADLTRGVDEVAVAQRVADLGDVVADRGHQRRRAGRAAHRRRPTTSRSWAPWSGRSRRTTSTVGWRSPASSGELQTRPRRSWPGSGCRSCAAFLADRGDRLLRRVRRHDRPAGGTRAIARALADTGDQVADVGRHREPPRASFGWRAAEGLAERSDELADAGAALRLTRATRRWSRAKESAKWPSPPRLVGGAGDRWRAPRRSEPAGALEDVASSSSRAQEDVARGGLAGGDGTDAVTALDRPRSRTRATPSARWTSSASRRPPTATGGWGVVVVRGVPGEGGRTRPSCRRGRAGSWTSCEGRVEFLGATSTTLMEPRRVRPRPAAIPSTASGSSARRRPRGWRLWPARLDGLPEELERLEAAGAASRSEIAAASARHHGIERRWRTSLRPSATGPLRRSPADADVDDRPRRVGASVGMRRRTGR